MADLQQDRIGGGEPPRRPDRHGADHFDHVAVGYTNHDTLNDFIDGESGDLIIHGPIHTGAGVREVDTLGPSVARGTPCLVVPLIPERIDEIQHEVTAALSRFQEQRQPRDGTGAEQGELANPEEYRAVGEDGELAPRPHTFRETGGTARGTSSGAIRKGSIGERD